MVFSTGLNAAWIKGKKTGRKHESFTDTALDAAFDCPSNFAATKTARANVDTLRGSVDDRPHASDIWLPHTVAPPMGMADFDSKGHAFVADRTFCHLLHLLAWVREFARCHDFAVCI